MKKAKHDRVSEMRAEYDFREGVHGKYAAKLARGSNIIVLEPDIAKVFRDSKSVNHALRSLLDLARRESHARKGRSA